jgi:hypothetical protein
MTDYPIGTYAQIEVDHGDGSRSWPIVERDIGAWQSGENRYPDAVVRTVKLLPLVADGIEARRHVADARRIIEAAIRVCDSWDDQVVHWTLDGRAYEQGRRRAVADCAEQLREAMAVAGTGLRPVNCCGCDRHRGDHSQCYAGCDLSGCRDL